MPKWVLKCENCNNEFTHSMITDQGAESYFLPQKPDLGEGAELECLTEPVNSRILQHYRVFHYLFALATGGFSDTTHQAKLPCVAYSSSNSMNNRGSRHLFEMRLRMRFSSG